MIIALFGKTCSGKSTAGRALASALDLELRSCGDAVRFAANERGVSLSDLSDEQHRAIDAETVAWVRSREACIVEGRFLDAVLADERSVLAFRLEASDERRAVRACSRGRPSEVPDVRLMDGDDDTFRSRLYGTRTLGSHIVIDTSNLTIGECRERVLTFIPQHLSPGSLAFAPPN